MMVVSRKIYVLLVYEAMMTKQSITLLLLDRPVLPFLNLKILKMEVLDRLGMDPFFSDKLVFYSVSVGWVGYTWSSTLTY